jgi:hypothetical protein
MFLNRFSILGAYASREHETSRPSSAFSLRRDPMRLPMMALLVGMIGAAYSVATQATTVEDLERQLRETHTRIEEGLGT